MNLLPKPNPENDAIRNAFITTSVALYLQACHLQHEEETEAVMLSFLIANATSGQPGSTPGNQSGGGNASQGNAGSSGDDDDPDEINLGSSLVNNTGQTTSDSDFQDAGDLEMPRKNNHTTGQSAGEEDKEPHAVTSPGGSGDSRIIGGVDSEDTIDWTGAVDKGTKDADAATG